MAPPVGSIRTYYGSDTHEGPGLAAGDVYARTGRLREGIYRVELLVVAPASEDVRFRRVAANGSEIRERAQVSAGAQFSIVSHAFTLYVEDNDEVQVVSNASAGQTVSVLLTWRVLALLGGR